LTVGNLPPLPTGQLYTLQVHLGIRKASIGEDLLLHSPPDVVFIESDPIVHVQVLFPSLLSIVETSGPGKLGCASYSINFSYEDESS